MKACQREIRLDRFFFMLVFASSEIDFVDDKSNIDLSLFVPNIAIALAQGFDNSFIILFTSVSMNPDMFALKFYLLGFWSRCLD